MESRTSPGSTSGTATTTTRPSHPLRPHASVCARGRAVARRVAGIPLARRAVARRVAGIPLARGAVARRVGGIPLARRAVARRVGAAAHCLDERPRWVCYARKSWSQLAPPGALARAGPIGDYGIRRMLHGVRQAACLCARLRDGSRRVVRVPAGCLLVQVQDVQHRATRATSHNVAQ